MADETMKTGTWVAAILAVLMLPLLVLGLLDPLEGGIALLLAVILGLFVRLLSKVPIPKLAWISMLVAIALAIITIVLAVTLEATVGPGGEVRSPLYGAPMVLIWVYRAATLVTVAGAILYVVKLFRAAQHESVVAGAARIEAASGETVRDEKESQ